MIITNEVLFVEEYLAKQALPPKMGVKRWLNYLMRYYYESCKDMSTKEYANVVIKAMEKFKISPVLYSEWQYGNWIRSQCGKIKKGTLPSTLLNCSEVVITKPEMDLINSANTEREQKVLFTFYVLAKIRSNPTGWVNYSLKDIFEKANVSIPAKDRAYFLGNIDRQGLLNYDHTMRTNGNKVELIDGEPEVVITDFNNLGRQYIALTKPGWYICQNCGKLVKRKSEHDYSSKYCKSCAEIINRENAKINRYITRRNRDNDV